MSIFPCPWRRRLVCKPGKKCSGNCWIAANYTWSETNCRKSKTTQRTAHPLEIPLPSQKQTAKDRDAENGDRSN
jgi:hypothetical protein